MSWLVYGLIAVAFGCWLHVIGKHWRGLWNELLTAIRGNPDAITRAEMRDHRDKLESLQDRVTTLQAHLTEVTRQRDAYELQYFHAVNQPGEMRRLVVQGAGNLKDGGGNAKP